LQGICKAFSQLTIPLLGLPFGRPHTQHLGQMAAKKQLPTASRLLGDCSCSDCLTHHTLLNEIAFFENTSIVFMPRATLALNSFYEAGLNMLDGSRDSHLVLDQFQISFF